MTRQGEGGLVCKKLCSTLTTYFIQAPLLWEQPLLHLALSFHQGDAVAAGDIDPSKAAIAELLQALDDSQLQVLLWLAGTLAEEVGRVIINSPALARLHNQMETIVRDASLLMDWAFSCSTKSAESKARAEALRTFLTWINYAQPIWPRNPEALQRLRNLIAPAAQCLVVETLQIEALDIFRDILESYTTFFQQSHMDLLAGIIYEHVRPRLLTALKPEQDLDELPYGQIVIAFGCANIQQVVEQPSNQVGSEAIVNLHLDILAAEGYPGDDDQLSIQSIEFWNTYIEYVNDTLYSKDEDQPDPAWLNQAKYVMDKVVELLWKKIWTPPNEVAKGWDDAESDGFKEFRLDSTDLMLSIFVLRGKDMLHQLVTLALHSLEARQWRAVEAALFCLNTLSDNVLEDAENEKIVGGIFRSNLFLEIADFSQGIPSQARRTAIDMLGSYGQYIERHAEFLPHTLRFLFASLEMAGLANAAAKSIASLCSTCRANLTGELPGFLSQYQRFLESKTSDPYTKEKVIGAIAAIIQAMSPESAKAQPLLALLRNVEEDSAAAKKYAAGGDVEMTEVMGITALECLASIGKGMQVPDDLPIDIYEEDEKPPEQQNYWDTEEGQAVQQQIVGCFSVLQVVGTYSAAIEAACHVLRSGFTETQPGPFVLPTSVTVNFLQQCTIHTPQVDSVLSVACMLITQHSKKDSRRIDEEAKAIYTSVAGFIQSLGQSSNDPGTACGCIEILTRLMPYYTHILFGGIDASTLDFTLSAIEGHENFPKRAACDFWTKLIKPQTAPTSDDVHQRINQVMALYGPKFTASLVRQFGGQAQRSDLDYLCEPLKALLLNQGSTQAWLQQGLQDGTFPSSKVGVDERMRFLRQIMSLRSDGKKIKELIRAFWAACRGTVVNFGS